MKKLKNYFFNLKMTIVFAILNFLFFLKDKESDNGKYMSLLELITQAIISFLVVLAIILYLFNKIPIPKIGWVVGFLFLFYLIILTVTLFKKKWTLRL